MFSYFLSRRRLSRSFEPCDGGFLYRRRPTAQAVPVTAEEREQILRTFKSTYWKYHAILWVLFFILIFAAAGLAVISSVPDEAGTFIGYLCAVILFAGIIFVDRRILSIATASISARPPVQPRRNWLQLIDARLATVPWWRLAAGGAFLVLLAWVKRSIATASLWGSIGWVCYFAFCFGMWIRNVWRKWQLAARV